MHTCSKLRVDIRVRLERLCAGAMGHKVLIRIADSYQIPLRPTDFAFCMRPGDDDKLLEWGYHHNRSPTLTKYPKNEYRPTFLLILKNINPQACQLIHAPLLHEVWGIQLFL